jgi:hypothetical protein
MHLSGFLKYVKSYDNKATDRKQKGLQLPAALRINQLT